MHKFARIGIVVLITTFLVLLPAYAIGESPFHFNKAVEKNPNINGNFDIVYFGATPQGSYIEFWIQVRDKIDENPQKGFLNAYIINIYGNETYQFGIAWWNENGSISEKVWFAREEIQHLWPLRITV